MAKQISIDVRGEKIKLFAQKAACWERRKTLILADPFWNRPSSPQRHRDLYDTRVQYELERIRSLLVETGSERIVILGDVLEGAEPLTKANEIQIAEWRKAVKIPILRVRSGGGKAAAIPDDWGIEWIQGSLLDEPFCFRHEPSVESDYFSWCGKIHPVWNIGRAKERLRLPCFWIGDEVGILPSFAAVSGGFPIAPGRSDQIYVIAECEILAMSPH